MRRAVFLIFCLEGAILSFNVAASSALVPAIAADFGVSQFLAGRLVWLYMLPYGVAALFYGPLVRCLDARRIELCCFLFFSLANLLAGLAQTLTTLFFARFLMGLFGASVIPLVLILIGRHEQNARKGRRVGVFFAATFAASLLGVALSGLMHWRLIFLIPAGAGLLLLGAMYLCLPSFRDEGTLRFNYLAALGEKGVVRIFAYIFFISLFYHGLQQWLGVYFSVRFRLSQLLISTLIMLTSLAGILGEVIGGWSADALGRRATANIGTALMIASVIALAAGMPLAWLAGAMAIWGLGWTFNHAGLSTILTDLPKESLHEAASLNSGVRFLSGGLGAAAAGFLMQKSFAPAFAAFALGLAGLLAAGSVLLPGQRRVETS